MQSKLALSLSALFLLLFTLHDVGAAPLSKKHKILTLPLTKLQQRRADLHPQVVRFLLRIQRPLKVIEFSSSYNNTSTVAIDVLLSCQTLESVQRTKSFELVFTNACMHVTLMKRRANFKNVTIRTFTVQWQPWTRLLSACTKTKMLLLVLLLVPPLPLPRVPLRMPRSTPS